MVNVVEKYIVTILHNAVIMAAQIFSETSNTSFILFPKISIFQDLLVYAKIFLVPHISSILII